MAPKQFKLVLSLFGPRPWSSNERAQTGLAFLHSEDTPKDDYLGMVATACLAILSKEVTSLYHQELAEDKFQEILQTALERRRESVESEEPPENLPPPPPRPTVKKSIEN